MGILSRVHESRSYTITGSVKDPALAKLFSGGRQSVAGPIVNELTAFVCGAFWDGVDQIASDTAKLPLNYLKRREDGGSDAYVESKTYKLLKYSPNPFMRSMVFRRTITAHALVYGNGYAEIERNGEGKPIALWLIHPNRVQPFYDKESEVDGQRFPLRYRVDNRITLEAKNVLHIQGLSDDGSEGYNLVSVAREALGLALASQQFAAAFFGNGTRFGGILMAKDRDLDPGDEDSKTIQAAIAKLHERSDKAFRLLVLGAGFEYKETGVKPNESQMKEIRDQQVAEVARYLHMPLHKLKLAIPGAVSYASVEMSDLDYYKGPILTWITTWEEELNAKLVPSLELGLQYFKHNARAFLRTDFKSQNEGLGIARDKGIINADEWREYLDMNPQPDGQGKLYLVQSAQIPVSRLDALAEAQIEATNAKAKKDATPAPAPDREQELERQILTLHERAERAEAASSDARAEAQQLHDDVIRLQTSGEATAQQLAETQTREEEANGRAMQLGVLAADLRTEHAAMLAARDALAQQLAEQTSARAAAEASAQDAQARADAAEAARQAADSAAHDAIGVADSARMAAEDAAQQARTFEAEARAIAEAETSARAAADQVAEDARARAEAAEAARASAEAAAYASIEAADTARQEAERLRDAAEVARVEAERIADEARVRAEAAESERATMADRVSDAERIDAEARSARERALADVQEAQTRASSLDAALEALRGQLATAEGEWTTRTAERAAEIDALRSAADTLTRERDALRAQSTELETRCSALRAVQAETEQALSEARRVEAARLTAVLASHRGLFVEAMGRMVRWETSKARRSQATPEKLRAWIDSFYVTHEDTCCDALLPAVRVHLAWKQSAEDPLTVTRSLVREHVTESVRQLRAVANGDAEDLHVSLERMLQRWEEDRPAALADRVLQEEVEYVRSLRV